VSAGVDSRLAPLVRAREEALTSFLAAHAERIALACLDLARALSRGGTLLAHGHGAAATDAAHVAVEFMHPVIVGKRALPALALRDLRALTTLAGADDVLLSLAHRRGDERAAAMLAEARRRGLLTIALTAGDGAEADHVLAVDCDDPLVVQEVQETTYHVLWELVHVFFEHPGLLEQACVTCGDVAVPARIVALDERGAVVQRGGATERVAIDLVEDVAIGETLLCHAGVALEKVPEPEPEPDPTAFLYPFLDAGERGIDDVLADVRASTLRKGADTVALRGALDVAAVAACGTAIGDRLRAGGRLIAFGNGGSSTDAQDAAVDFQASGWPALALNDDVATITAVGNDVGYENAFARQLIPLGRARDVAVAFSTSGSSANIVAGLEEGHRRGMLTCAITGYDGGRLAQLGWLDHLLVVRGDYIPRLQEAHATIHHLLLTTVAARG
jgi:D-sedoheptulose 7-phosphate isomerase